MKKHAVTIPVKSRTWFVAMTLCLALTIPCRLSAQQTRFRLIDVGTLGGPNSSPALPNLGLYPVQSVNNQGMFAGQADTALPDPFPGFCFNEGCLISHAFEWQNGVVADLGGLTSGVSSSSAWVSTSGLIVGVSENGQTDPLISGFPEFRAVLWKHDKIIDLGTLEGGNESFASAVNSRGQVVGLATTTNPDPNSMAGFGYQTLAFLWQNGVMQNLGTLPGGSDSIALAVNDQGHVMGQSYTAESAPSATPFCAFFPLSQHGFFWENGKMLDIGTLGGSCTFTFALNNLGQVVGQSTIGGDATSHPFLWQRGTITDLGTLGGTYGYANWINDSGEVVGGSSEVGDQALNAFLWKDGVRIRLGTVNGGPCSDADAINSKGQVVGLSGGFATGGHFPACETQVGHAVLWENGSATDLNSFVPPASELTLTEATSINDRGEIGGVATLPNGDTHAFLLIPCGPQDTDGCQDADEGGAATRVSTVLAQPLVATNQINAVRRMSSASFTTANHTKTVNPPGSLAITSGFPPDGIVGTPYGGTHFYMGHTFTGFHLTASGGVPGYTWSWTAAPGSSRPPGLKLHVIVLGGSTRCCVYIPVIAGVPTVPGSYKVIVTVTDSASPPAKSSANYTIKIQ